MAEQEPRESAGATPGAEPITGDTPASDVSPAEEYRYPPTPEPQSDASLRGEPSAPPTGEMGADEPAAPAADVWESFDAALVAFGTEHRAGVGSFWGEGSGDVEGRFANWSNTSGWRCSLQLVRAPEENVVVLVAQGPPLPGGRARVMILGAFPPDFEHDNFRAALEVGYGIGETWGPAEDPPEPSPTTPPEAPPPPAP